MSSPNNTSLKDIRGLDRSSMGFLSLAPTTSESYPTTQKSVPERAGGRRSSSLGSEQSFRYLKLGPVHWGEHPDENKEDYNHIE